MWIVRNQRKNFKAVYEPIVIKGQPVEMVDNYLYLGTIINNRLDWSPNIDKRYPIANQRMFCLNRLKKFRISRNILELFYRTTIQSAMLFNQLCYYGNADNQDKDRLGMISQSAARVIGKDISTPCEVYDHSALRKLHRILADKDHCTAVKGRNCRNEKLRPFTAGKVG